MIEIYARTVIFTKLVQFDLYTSAEAEKLKNHKGKSSSCA